MALTKGNVTTSVNAPNGSPFSITTHTHNSGANGYLFVTIASPAISIASVTWDGVAMTLVRQESPTYAFWSIWRLASPAVGNKTLTVTPSSGNWNNTSTTINSFLDCSGVGNTAYNGSPNNPVTTSLTILANSMLLGTAIGGNGTTAYIGLPQGSNRTLDYNNNISNFTWGAVSPSLTAGTKTCESGSTATGVIMVAEIREVVSAPTSTQGMMMMF